MSSAEVKPKRSNRIRLLFGYALAVASVFFVSRYLRINTGQFLDSLASIEPWRVGVAMVCFLLMLAINACAFAITGRALGVRASMRTLLGAWLASLLSKYIPVGIGHIAGRGLLLVSRGTGWRAVIATGAFEQSVSLVWCAIIAWAIHASMMVLPWVALAAVSLGAISAIVYRSLGFAARSVAATAAILLYGIAMLPYAAGYIMLVDTDDLGRFVSALFAGTIGGVLSIVSPGGLGVRESIATAIVSDEAGTMLAELLMARLAILVTEIFGSVVGGWFLARNARAHGEAL